MYVRLAGNMLRDVLAHAYEQQLAHQMHPGKLFERD